MTLQPKHPDVQRIAKRLAGGYVNSAIQITDDGLSIPLWMFFVSEAQRIWDAHCCANDLKQT